MTAYDTIDALTADGAIVQIRSVTPADRDALADLYYRASADNLRMRFFAPPAEHVISTEVARLTRAPSPEHSAILAERTSGVVGVASWERPSDVDRRAEFAVFVDEAQHGRGIGTLLLEHLASRARACGIRELVGEVLPGNAAMLRVATDLTGRVFSRFADGVVDVGMATNSDEITLAAVDSRERVAERASLRPLLAPRSVAVVGAGRAPGGIGHETLRALAEYGFTGDLHAVNPHADSVAGVPAYPSLRDVPGPVDLAVIAVPAVAVAATLADAAAVGVRAVVILSSGFGEESEAGRTAQADLVRVARTQGIRVVGPNCIGVLNTDPAVRLAAAFVPTRSADRPAGAGRPQVRVRTTERTDTAPAVGGGRRGTRRSSSLKPRRGPKDPRRAAVRHWGGGPAAADTETGEGRPPWPTWCWTG